MKKVNVYVSELGEDFLTKDREEFEKELPISDPVHVDKKEITQSALNKRLSRIQNSIKTTTDKANEIIEISDEVQEKIGKKDYSQEYFTMVVTTAGNIIWEGNSSNALSYSTDGGETWSTANSYITLAVNEGDKVLWKGTTTPSSSGIGVFITDFDYDSGYYNDIVRYTIEGNAMSLLFGDDFKGQTSLEGKNNALKHLFYYSKNITSAENLLLPATTLSQNCYSGMFYGCTNLTTAPELPATTLANACYASMFSGCTILTTAPELPATTLASSCYKFMFSSCGSLTTAPELPATTLAQECYYGMFSSTRLTTAPELPATTLAEQCYRTMFQWCRSLTTAPELPATTLAGYCYDSMFDSCGSLTTAPELPATTLAKGCYSSMFKDCTSLTATPELSATMLASSCYQGMFQSCTNLTTVPAVLPATTLTTSCYSGMFSGCSSLTTAPELPATTLANYCYNVMFYRCTNLNSIKCLATNISATDCTRNWVEDVASSGTFTKASSMSSWTIGKNGIPSGWSVVNA